MTADQCNEITHFGKWGHSNRRCHKPQTHQIVIGGVVTKRGCQQHVERLAGRYAVRPTVEAIPHGH